MDNGGCPNQVMNQNQTRAAMTPTRMVVAFVGLLIATLFAVGALGGPTAATAEAQPGSFDACDEELPGDSELCSIELYWECDGTIYPYVRGDFGLFGEDGPDFSNATITTLVTDRGNPAVSYPFTGNPTSGGSTFWSYSPGALDDPAPAPRGSYSVDISVEGLDVEGISFDATREDILIDTDCVRAEATCSAVTATLLDDGSGTFPEVYDTQYLDVGIFGSGSLDEIPFVGPEVTYTFDPAQAGIFYFDVHEEYEDEVGSLHSNDPYGVKEDFKGSVANDRQPKATAPAKTTTALAQFSGAAMSYQFDEYDGILYTTGTVVCLEPYVDCANGLVTLGLSAGSASDFAIEQTRNAIGPMTVNDGHAANDGTLWPDLTYTFDARPDTIVFDEFAYDIAHVGIFEMPTIPRCIYEISSACDTEGDWVVTEDSNEDGLLPEDTETNHTGFEIAIGETVTFSVHGEDGDNGVRFSDDGELVSEITFTKQQCRAEVTIYCVAGVPVIDIEVLAPPPDAFTHFTIDGANVGNGTTAFEIANRVDAIITSQPSSANVMLDAPQLRATQNVTGLTLPGSDMVEQPIDAGLDCRVEASIECAANDDDPTARPEIVVDTGGTLLIRPRGYDTRTVWYSSPYFRDLETGDVTTLTVGSPNEGPPRDNGVVFTSTGERTRAVTIPECQIGFETICGVDLIDDELVPNGRTLMTYPGLEDTPSGTTTTPAEGADVTSSAGDTITISVDNGVQFAGYDDNVIEEVYVEQCLVTVRASAFCVDGWPYATFTFDPFGEFGIDVVNGTRAHSTLDLDPLTYRWDVPYLGDDMLPQSMSFELFAYPENVLVSPSNPFVVTSPTCRIDATVACPATGADVGHAVFMTDLTGTPLGTMVINDDTEEPLTDGQVIEPGGSLTISATHGVHFNIDDEEVDSASSLRLAVPYCTITITTATSCIAGQPHATVEVSIGEYSVAVVNGVRVDFDETLLPALGDDAPADVSGYVTGIVYFDASSFDSLYRFTGDPITITLEEVTPNAVVDPSNPVVLDRPVCQIEIDVNCVAGQAILTITSPGDGLARTPAGTALSPTEGVVDQGISLEISTTNQVQFVASEDDSITVETPVCEVSAVLVCQTADGLPTGVAVLQTTIPTGVPEGTTITPGSGTTVASETTLVALVNNGVHFSSSDAASDTLLAPACVVAATGVAVCANGTIEITVSTSGGEASAVVINGAVIEATGTTTVIDGLAPLALYEVSAVPADPRNVVAGASELVPLSSRCFIDITVALQCLSEDVILITASTAASSTGSVSSIAVNGDSNLPFTVAPGDDALLTVASPDTLQTDIAIPVISVPANCDNSPTPLAATLYLSYTAVCDALGEQVIIEVSTEGSAGIIALAVNGDAAAPYTVAPAQPIIVTVLTFVAKDAVIITGPNQAPVCLAPTPTPGPPPTLPPAVVVSFIPVPQATPEPTPEATPEPTPEATPTPTPEATPEPEPEATPTPTPTPEAAPEPSPEPEPEPDEVLSERTSIRQHGQSTIELPAACDVEHIDLPGAVRLVREGVTDGGRIRFVVDTATLDVGNYKETISCAGQQVDVELFIYRQIGGARGEANSISRLAVTGGILTLVLIGIPGIIGRREDG